jgi:RNA polymerase sigma factor (sigma-70 family)
MTGGRIHNLLQYLRRATPSAEGPVLSDTQLLERFAATRDEASFEVLARRHGPMIMGVCRRVLGDVHEAEDALQATFLILARKAAAVAGYRSVGGWLYTVAYRVALRARARRAARSGREHPLDESPASAALDPASAAAWREVRQVIDEEVSRLPEKYRAPFVLFHLEGRSSAEVARELGCPVGTVESWLTRARQRLRAGLARRQLTPALGLLAALSIPEGWLAQASAAAQAALAEVRGEAGAVSPEASALAGEVLRAFGAAKTRVALLLLVLAVAVVGAVSLMVRASSPATPPPRPPEVLPRDKEGADGRAGGTEWVRIRTIEKAHVACITGIAWSPDGKILVSAGDDGRVKLWDWTTGKMRVNLCHFWDLDKPPAAQQAHVGRVYAVAFSPDGKTIATGASDRTAKLWEVATGRERAIGDFGAWVSSVAFSPDSRYLAAVGSAPSLAFSGPEVRFWRWGFLDPDSKVPVVRIYYPDPRDKTGKKAKAYDLPLKGSDLFKTRGVLKVWDLLRNKGVTFFNEASGPLTCVAFSPNGKMVAAGGRDSGVRLWHLATGLKCTTYWERDRCITGLAYSPDGKTLAVVSALDESPLAPPPKVEDDRVTLRALPSGKVRARLKGTSGWVTAIEFSPDGKILATGSDVLPPRARPWTNATGQVQLWDVATGRPLGDPLTFSHRVASVAFHRNGEILAVGGPAASPPGAGAYGWMTLMKLSPRDAKAP